MVGDIAPTAEAGRHVTRRVLSEVEQSHGHASLPLGNQYAYRISCRRHRRGLRFAEVAHIHASRHETGRRLARNSCL